MHVLSPLGSARAALRRLAFPLVALLAGACSAIGSYAGAASPPAPPQAAADSVDARPDSAEAPVSTPVAVAAVRPPAPLTHPPAVAREFRAVWISPVGSVSGSDWPSRPGLSAEEQKAELRVLLDRTREIGLNAVVFHVRTAGDALYPTPHAPWSAFLTGTSGADPGYDPLAFAIQEAHARGLQLHAWFNPFRAMLPNFEGRAAAGHVTRRHPAWVRRYGKQTWIDPGEPAARKAVLEAIVDVVRRYDVDGVHIDDYFYPYRESETVKRRVKRRTVTTRRDIPFPDAKTWARYGKARGWTDRAAWRRDNVNGFVRSLYEGVKAEKPWVLVGISPFGIWRSGTPRGVTGLDAYGEIYADARLWLEKGWADYMAPQLYWQLGGTQDRFRALDRWWRGQNPQGRHIWPGFYTAQTHSGSTQWSPAEIARQIEHVRDTRAGTDESPGHVHFRMGALLAETGPLGDRLASSLYAEPALAPDAPWLAAPGTRAPAAPRLIAEPAARGTVSVSPVDGAAPAWWLVQLRSPDGRWSSTLHRAAAAPSTRLLVELPDGGEPDEVAVSAVDRVGRVGAPAIVRWPGGAAELVSP